MKLFNHKPKQYTWVYCPTCKLELIDTNCYVGSVPGRGPDWEFEQFKCKNCETISIWDFDLAPAPVYVSHLDCMEPETHKSFPLYRILPAPEGASES